MSTFRIHKTSDFTVMSNHHLKNKSLSLKSKGLLSIMLSLPDNWDYSVLGLAALSKDGKDAISSSLDELKKHGYLVMTQTVIDGKFSGWQYDVYEIPHTEISNTKKPYSENPYSENPPQYNTNNSNISSHRTTYGSPIVEDNTNENKNEKIKPSQKKREKEKFDLSFVAPEFGAAFIEWLEYKHEIKDAYTTQRGVKAAYDSLVDLSNGNPEVAMAIVKQSEANNWKGLFKLKDYGKSVSTYSGTAAGATQYRNDSERLYAESAAFLQAIASQNN